MAPHSKGSLQPCINLHCRICGVRFRGEFDADLEFRVVSHIEARHPLHALPFGSEFAEIAKQKAAEYKRLGIADAQTPQRQWGLLSKHA